MCTRRGFGISRYQVTENTVSADIVFICFFSTKDLYITSYFALRYIYRIVKTINS